MGHMPSLRQLRYVVALAEHANFGRAAAACHVAQSSFSAGIQEAEALLGLTLFERTTRKVLVTPEGEAIVGRARRVLREAADLVEAASAARGPLSGPLRLGAIPTVGPYLLPRLLPRLARVYPTVTPLLREEQSARLLERLEDGQLDVLLLATPFALGDLETASVCRDGFVLVCPAGHRLAGRDRVSPGELADEALLLLEDGHCLRGHALAACQLDAAAREVFQATSLRTLVQMVAGGLGVTLLPAMAVADEVRDARVRAVALDGAAGREVVLAWRRSSPRAAAYRELASVMREGLAA